MFVFINEENKSKEIQRMFYHLQNLFWGAFGFGGFVWGFLLGGLCPGVFVLSPKPTYTKLSDEQNVDVTTVVCNLIVHDGFLPVIFMGPKNFKYLRSTEHLQVFKERSGIC